MNCRQKQNRNYYLRKKGERQGWLAIREVCELKSVSIKKIENNIGIKIHICRTFTKIKYDKNLIEWN